MKAEEHRFFCINCGQETFSVWRGTNKLRKKNHRKKLWCIHCQKELNMVECRDIEDVLKFKEAFNNGEFKEEAEECLSYLGDTSIR